MTQPLPPPLAFGRTAEVYPWGGTQVLKLFHEAVSRESIEYEQRIALAIQDTELPVPAVGEIVRLNGRDGLLYQRVEGVPMAEKLQRKPWCVFKYAKHSAILHHTLHSSRLQAGVPSQPERLQRKILSAKELQANLQRKVLTSLERMPSGESLCHGDFHPGNILLTTQGLCIIDWIDATIGNPLADVARSSIILLGLADCQVRNPWLRGFIRLFHRLYLWYYFRLNPDGKREYQLWLPIIAAARLSEKIPGLKGWLLRQVER